MPQKRARDSAGNRADRNATERAQPLERLLLFLPMNSVKRSGFTAPRVESAK